EPLGDRAFAAHGREGVKERAAGFSREPPLIAHQLWNHRARDDRAARPARAPVHRPDQHDRSLWQRRADAANRFARVLLVLIHREGRGLALIWAGTGGDPI